MALHLIHQNADLVPAASAAEARQAQIDSDQLRYLIRNNAKLMFRFRSDKAIAGQWRGKKMPLRRLKGKIKQQAAATCRLLKKIEKKAARAQTLCPPDSLTTESLRIARSPQDHAVQFMHSVTGHDKDRIRDCLVKPFDANRVVFRLAAEGAFACIQVKRSDGAWQRYALVGKRPDNG